MGAWGIKALESDADLDVVDFLRKYIGEPGEPVTLRLGEFTSISHPPLYFSR